MSYAVTKKDETVIQYIYSKRGFFCSVPILVLSNACNIDCITVSFNPRSLRTTASSVVFIPLFEESGNRYRVGFSIKTGSFCLELCFFDISVDHTLEKVVTDVSDWVLF